MTRIEIQTKSSVVSCAAPSSLSLRQNFSLTMSGNVIYAGCRHIGGAGERRPPEAVGVFALALALATPVMMLLDLQLRSVQATDSTEEYRFGEYLGLRLITTAVGFLVIAVLVFGSGHRGSTLLVILGVAVLSALMQNT